MLLSELTTIQFFHIQSNHRLANRQPASYYSHSEIDFFGEIR